MQKLKMFGLDINLWDFDVYLEQIFITPSRN